jgi:hypothetical protein
MKPLATGSAGGRRCRAVAREPGCSTDSVESAGPDGYSSIRRRGAMKTRIMYIENKAGSLSGEARIGRVSFSKSGKSVYYRGRRFQTLAGSGFKANYLDCETREEYWISGCKKNGLDRLYPGTVEIDEDVRKEYWSDIRQQPEHSATTVIRCLGKYGKRT